jgi:hypothetical protein
LPSITEELGPDRFIQKQNLEGRQKKPPHAPELEELGGCGKELGDRKEREERCATGAGRIFFLWNGGSVAHAAIIGPTYRSSKCVFAAAELNAFKSIDRPRHSRILTIPSSSAGQQEFNLSRKRTPARLGKSADASPVPVYRVGSRPFPIMGDQVSKRLLCALCRHRRSCIAMSAFAPRPAIHCHFTYDQKQTLNHQG